MHRSCPNVSLPNAPPMTGLPVNSDNFDGTISTDDTPQPPPPQPAPDNEARRTPPQPSPILPVQLGVMPYISNSISCPQTGYASSNQIVLPR
jgi:hypothetical protein